MFGKEGAGAGDEGNGGANAVSRDEPVVRGISGAGNVIRRLFQQRTRLWQQTLPDDIAGPQFTVLGVLCLHGAMDQRNLGHYASLDKSTAAPIVERLRARGLLTVERDTADARRKVLALTPTGRETVVQLAPYAGQVEDLLLGDLSPAAPEGGVSLRGSR
ncbi:MarR family winged helix-turn-helix transcriptional regulator [Actinacidiphila acididurans]|uniref:Winged helix-turn-helix transcriptional regulator n=1 Tax=Actinacidiphila acididurans TaxID=2784346 RepID=A0ABS2TU61_9ACTN|nr:MarR family winged helix-turn-helix transcriptional regulator [Actinacidiphila acididurans]MBM9506868.1 winged helix-turn-helix transcriptional regulator [Actinacidiphila acididurans]